MYANLCFLYFRFPGVNHYVAVVVDKTDLMKFLDLCFRRKIASSTKPIFCAVMVVFLLIVNEVNN